MVKNFRRVVVVSREGKLVGIISRKDIIDHNYLAKTDKCHGALGRRVPEVEMGDCYCQKLKRQGKSMIVIAWNGNPADIF